MSTAPLAPLVDLGFTSLEADIYAWLLEEAPATGYRIAQALRKPVSNIYKAVESLEAKGAVIVEEGGKRLYRALPPDELLGQLERRFQERKARAAESFSRLSGAREDAGVYRLRSAEAVFERARSMLRRAEQIAILDIFPAALEALRPDIEAATARGVDVALLAYAPTTLAGATVVVAPTAEDILDRWPGQWLCLDVDGAEYMLAFLTPGGDAVHQAVWTCSPSLSWVHHSAHAAELILAAVENAVESTDDIRIVRRTLHDFARLRAQQAPGYQSFRRRMGESSLLEGDEA